MTGVPNGFSIGDSLEAEEDVTPDRTAAHIGSGDLRVYATPAMALLVERTCRDLVEPSLPEGQTTVGVDIRVRHLAPTPVGGVVRIRVEIVGVDGEAVDFRAEIRDSEEPIGLAEHRRRIIDADRFLRRVRAKAERVAGESPGEGGLAGEPD